MIRSGRHVVIPAGVFDVRVRAPAAAAAAAWWVVAGKTCVAAYQPKGAASQAASYVNLANPGTYDASVGFGVVNWDTLTGWSIGIGWPASYMLSGIPYDSTDIAVFIRFANRNVTTPFVLGTTASGTLHIIQTGSDGWATLQWENGGLLSLTGQVETITSATCGLSGAAAYYNGINKGVIPGGTASGGNILLSGNYAGTTIAIMDIVAFWFGQTLTDAEAIALQTRMVAL